MNAHDLTVSTTQDGQVRVLTVAGDLDVTTAARFMEDAPQAVDGRTERFVWDLAGLTFLDGAGARALAEATLGVPAGCPVIVRSVSRPASHLLGLLDLDLERLGRDAGAAPARPAGPERQPVAAGSRWDQMVLEIARVAVAVAETEEKVAATLTWLAQGRQPTDAARLVMLSEHARYNAAHSRRWVDAHAHPARVTRPGRLSAGP
jgi:anti-anti-sigma factor